MKTDHVPLRKDADNCRRMALVYVRLPEATFLISAARAFEDLADAADRPVEIAVPGSTELVTDNRTAVRSVPLLTGPSGHVMRAKHEQFRPSHELITTAA